MLRFNTAFLLKATAITALGCLPMAYNKQSGFVWTAFLLPFSLAWLTTTQVGKQGQFQIKFKELSGSVVEIDTTGGWYDQWLMRGRIIAAGACLSVAIGFPMLNIVDPEPIQYWLPLVVTFAFAAVVLVSYSARRRVLTEDRQFVTDYLLFGWLCWWRRRWQVREGDVLAVFASNQSQHKRHPELQFRHMLYVCRAHRRHLIAGMFTGDRVAHSIENAGDRVAKLVNVPFDGYREA